MLFRVRAMSALAIVVLLAGCVTHQPARVDLALADNATGFIDMTTTAGGIEQPCVLYIPREYDPDKAWPLIVFLHGMGERGSDGLRQSATGIGDAIRKYPKRFPCLVLMPQCPSDAIWGPPLFERLGKTVDATPHIDDAIVQVLKSYNIDRDRISLTGLSMGGFGTFIYGAQNADRFSAFMPVCGGGNEEDAAALAKRPMWVFHGADDPVVPPKRSRDMVEAIKAAGGSVQYTEYPGIGHNSWEKAYSDRKAIEWLLEQRR